MASDVTITRLAIILTDRVTELYKVFCFVFLKFFWERVNARISPQPLLWYVNQKCTQTFKPNPLPYVKKKSTPVSKLETFPASFMGRLHIPLRLSFETEDPQSE